jgi:large subunit ribosomal protein L15
MKLHELKSAEGSRRVRNRVGRGAGTGIMLVKPRFGKRRNKGNCPPSNPGLTLPPERAF